jgi:hypothetical protein
MRCCGRAVEQEGHDQGRGKVSISLLLRVSRPTVSEVF